MAVPWALKLFSCLRSRKGEGCSRKQTHISSPVFVGSSGFDHLSSIDAGRPLQKPKCALVAEERISHYGRNHGSGDMFRCEPDTISMGSSGEASAMGAARMLSDTGTFEQGSFQNKLGISANRGGNSPKHPSEIELQVMPRAYLPSEAPSPSSESASTGLVVPPLVKPNAGTKLIVQSAPEFDPAPAPSPPLPDALEPVRSRAGCYKTNTVSSAVERINLNHERQRGISDTMSSLTLRRDARKSVSARTPLEDWMRPRATKSSEDFLRSRESLSAFYMRKTANTDNQGCDTGDGGPQVNPFGDEFARTSTDETPNGHETTSSPYPELDFSQIHTLVKPSTSTFWSADSPIPDFGSITGRRRRGQACYLTNEEKLALEASSRLLSSATACGSAQTASPNITDPFYRYSVADSASVYSSIYESKPGSVKRDSFDISRISTPPTLPGASARLTPHFRRVGSGTCLSAPCPTYNPSWKVRIPETVTTGGRDQDRNSYIVLEPSSPTEGSFVKCPGEICNPKPREMHIQQRSSSNHAATGQLTDNRYLGTPSLRLRSPNTEPSKRGIVATGTSAGGARRHFGEDFIFRNTNSENRLGPFPGASDAGSPLKVLKTSVSFGDRVRDQYNSRIKGQEGRRRSSAANLTDSSLSKTRDTDGRVSMKSRSLTMRLHVTQSLSRLKSKVSLSGGTKNEATPAPSPGREYIVPNNSHTNTLRPEATSADGPDNGEIEFEPFPKLAGNGYEDCVISPFQKIDLGVAENISTSEDDRKTLHVIREKENLGKRMGGIWNDARYSGDAY